jgi:predicted acylesterase/phospholipase RssA
MPAASRFCDIVMKGGITSGVVYPAAVVEIAKDFIFKNVGGTSAGAIAAALTAAAERRRARDGTMDGFIELGNVPDWLAVDKHLFGLFTPNGATRSLFRTVVGLFGRPRFQPALLDKWLGLVWAFPIASAAGALPGIAFFVVLAQSNVHGVKLVLGALLGLATIAGGMSIGFIIAFARDLLDTLPSNCFGLVKGLDESKPQGGDALCAWLTRELETIAGLPVGEIPLTFGMLWDAKRDPRDPSAFEKPDQPDVNLEMITTNVTWGRPFTFPIAPLSFFFDPDELRSFFPEHVVTWLVTRARKPRTAEEADRFKHYLPRLPLPLASDLPVMLATRMSLAFPVLLSAVPLYASDFSLPMTADHVPLLERCWFSDGGISSNFPITLFDSPLPRWPTFAINLAPFQPAHPRQADESKNVYMPPSDGAGRLPAFSRFTAVPGFLSAIVNAMQNWNDTTQSVLPGYRDRIVTVLLADDEGGLNLDMPVDVLQRLKRRGTAAGALIAGRFKNPSLGEPGPRKMDWENHRWLRLRTSLGALRSYMSRLYRGSTSPLTPDIAYRDLLDAVDASSDEHYPFPQDGRARAAKLLDDLTALGAELDGSEFIDADLPKPSPDLVLRPDLGS